MPSDVRPFKYFFLGLFSLMFYRFFMRKKEPVVISVNEKEFEQLKKDLENNTLGEKEKKIMLAILETHHWLSQLYRAKRLSLERVKRLFGFKSEKERAPRSC